MEDVVLAYCGLNCDSCPILNATISGDDALLEKLAQEYSNEEFTCNGEELQCLGCHTEMISEKMCSGCEIRACGLQKDIIHCGQCGDYPCDIITAYLPEDHPARETLEEYVKNAKS